MDSVGIMDKVFLLPLIMASSFVIILFVGKRFSERVTSSIGIGAVGACFVLSLVIGAQWINRVDNPPTGAAAVAAEEACLGGPGDDPQAREGGGRGAEPGSAERGAPTGAAPGESAAVLGQEGGGSTESPSAEGGQAESAQAKRGETIPVCASITWFETAVSTSQTIKFEAGTVLDGLSALMLFVVSIISLLVHIYSKEYLHDDRRFTHYYAFLSLFTASMLFFVLGSNSLQMLVGWELVGVCSFVLIGHWWEEGNNTYAALKAFLTNRVGDTGLIIGVIVTFFAAGATSFNVFRLNEAALSGKVSSTLLLIGAIALFWGVTSKSGQFPLHTWLPDAMAGPTPVSALIHAATMVVAGVYLIARLYGVFYAGLQINNNTINYVAFIGGFTALIGAGLAFVQKDIKKVLAYSTVSQLGYMVMALGVGAWTAAVFHLFTHAFFKASMFLGAGSVSHACHHTFDMDEMGGLKKKMPITRWTFMFSGFALAGIFPFAGFFSKDEILAGAANGQGGNAYTIMLVFGLVVAFMTAAYMGRTYYRTFEGEYRGHAHPHESPKIMTIPLIILTTFATIGGVVNFPGKLTEWLRLPQTFGGRLEHYVQPEWAGRFPTLDVAEFNPWLATGSVLLALLGMFIGIGWYANRLYERKLTERSKVLHAGYTFLANKYYLDALYENVIRDRGVFPLARASYWFNQYVVDGIVNAVGVGSRSVGNFLYKYLDQGAIDGAVNGTGIVSDESGQLLRRIQTGKVQQYAALFFFGATVLTIFFVVFIR
ncbi:MAG: NADH-quinone oxidoreductase subunit L [Actinobacteria bacterium]|nr:NADH-quinone oxidoreductase subunit L [Actinomycetota bacterium]